MSGHLDNAAGTLSTAATAVPVEAELGVENQLGTVAQYLNTVGGRVAENLTPKALALQDDARQFAARLNALRGEIETAAQHVLASGT